MLPNAAFIQITPHLKRNCACSYAYTINILIKIKSPSSSSQLNNHLCKVSAICMVFLSRKRWYLVYFSMIDIGESRTKVWVFIWCIPELSTLIAFLCGPRVNRSVINDHPNHCVDVIMTAMASQITSLTIVYTIVYSGSDQRKHQSSASLAFVQGIHRWPVNSLHKGSVTRKMFPLDDVIMNGVWTPVHIGAMRQRNLMYQWRQKWRLLAVI